MNSGAKIRTHELVRNFTPMNSGAKILTHELVRNFAPMNWCEISHHVRKFFNFVPLTSDDHNFFIRTPFEVFLDSMESPLSQESRFIPVEDKWDPQPC